MRNVLLCVFISVGLGSVCWADPLLPSVVHPFHCFLTSGDYCFQAFAGLHWKIPGTYKILETGTGESEGPVSDYLILKNVHNEAAFTFEQGPRFVKPITNIIGTLDEVEGGSLRLNPLTLLNTTNQAKDSIYFSLCDGCVGIPKGQSEVFQEHTSTVSEPTTLALMGLGLAMGIFAVRRRQRPSTIPRMVSGAFPSSRLFT